MLKIQSAVLAHEDVVSDANLNSESAGRPPARLDSLTALRFFAALIVILPGCAQYFHLFGEQTRLATLGTQCVSFFFVLSGFLLSYNHSALESLKEIRDFWQSRVARIWTVHVFVLFLSLITLSFDASKLGTTPLSAVILANVSMIHGWILTGQYYLSVNPASWGVSTIFAFSLLFPLFINRFKQSWHVKLGTCAVIVAGFVFLAARVSPSVSDSLTGLSLKGLICINPLVRLLEFVLGMSCASLFQAIRKRSDSFFASSLVVSIGEIFSLFAVVLYLTNIECVTRCLEPFRVGRAIQCWLVFDGACFFFASLIFFCALQRGVVAKALTSKLLVWLGEISYPLILLHSLGLILFVRYGQSLFALGPWTCLLVYLSALTFVAFLVHKFVEQPWRARLAPSLASESKPPRKIASDPEAQIGVKLETKAEKDLKYIPFLDGLRAFAILSVLTFHNGGPIGELLSKRGGWVGVDAFFVISGFLITQILLKERERTNSISLKNFYVRRCLRLMPAYALFIAVTALINPHDWQRMPAAVGIAAIYMCDFDQAFGWGNIAGSGMEIGWSLSVEEKFYLFWPTIMRLARRYLPLIGVVAIAGCFAWRTALIYQNVPWTRLADGFDAKIDALMIGCLAAIALNNDNIRAQLKRYLRHGWIPLALGVGILLFMRTFSHPGIPTSIPDRLLFWNLELPLFTVLFTALVICLSVQPASLVTKFLSLPIMVWLGRISYSLYLWHMLAFLWALKIVNFHPTFGWDNEVCGIGMSIVLASISYYLVEKPFLTMKDAFTQRSYRKYVLEKT